MKVFSTLLTLAALTSPIFASPLPEAEPEPQASNPSQTQYQNIVLRHHNVHRRNHSASAVVWGPNMAKYALTLASRCVFQHNTSINDWGESYGQNLQIGSPASQVAVAVTDGWYNNEVQAFAGQYGKPTPDLTNFGSWGHFSQLVWKGSAKVGCATYDCTASGGLKDSNGNKIQGILPYMTVCNYYPVGNMLGSFDTNVGRPLGRPTVSVQ